jgi:hypothetical protein
MQDDSATDVRLQKALQTVKLLCDERDSARRTLDYLEDRIREAWKLVPHMAVRQEKPCRKCQRPTMETFGGTAMCRKHIAKDNDMASILERLIYDDGN